MGCDIHTFVEVTDDGKEWVLFDKPDTMRNYDLFERIAGVRGEEKNAISPPKGLPSDISKGTALHHKYWGEDAHSESWLHSKEIALLEKWYNAQNYRRMFEVDFGYLFGNGYNWEMEMPIQDWRFVVWFDN